MQCQPAIVNSEKASENHLHSVHILEAQNVILQTEDKTLRFLDMQEPFTEQQQLSLPDLCASIHGIAFDTREASDQNKDVFYAFAR